MRDLFFLPSRQRAACQRFGIEVPPGGYETHVCAFLLASRECIRQHPRAFYVRLHEWHSGCKSVTRRRGATEEELAPWLLEHLWQLIFRFDPPTDGEAEVRKASEKAASP